MTTDEIEVILANTISEINRLSSSIENIRQILGEVLDKRELSLADRAHLKTLLGPYQSDDHSLWLSEAGQKVRGRFEKEQTEKLNQFFQAGLKLPK